ncbi:MULTISPECIES: acyl carrier protein [Micromonospora]|uniref:Acyl carrier protein n=1 Tax=Micromonospora gifhornensis TaxID=84594 RepID=A0ABQ4IBP4_9ACTN|nr:MULTISPECIES: phosphopantetheine-binding protein [Micromonospora]PMR59271.1 phosphopantetheine-binding protein [Verrucosispora sp. ts21]GIJ15183.1 acyl carrier protein [Micromonospora gifhornensis]
MSDATIGAAPQAVAGDITNVVVGALGQMLSRDPASISTQLRLFEDLSFDSTSVLELLIQLEAELDVEFDTDTLEPADFETVGALVAYVAGQVEENA